MAIELQNDTKRAVRLSRRGTLRLVGALTLVGVVGCVPPLQSIKRAPPSPTSAPVSTSTPIIVPTVEPVATETPAIAPSATPIPSPTPIPTPAPRSATWWTGPTDDAWLSAATEVTRQVTIAHPEFTVRVSGGHSDFGRLVGAMASGQSPDVIDIGSIGPFASRAVIRALDDYLGAGTVSASNYPVPMWLNGAWDGKTFGIPALDHGPELGLVWNTTLAGTDLSSAAPPKLWADLYQAGRTLTRPAMTGPIDRFGFDPLDGVGSLLDTVRDVTGVDWYNPISRRVNPANSMYHEFLDGVVAYYNVIGPDRISQFRQDVSPLTNTADSGENQGKQVALLDGYWAMSSIARLEIDRTWQFSSTWAPTQRGTAAVQRLGGRLAVIPATAKNPANSWDLVQLLASDTASQAFLDRTGHFAATHSFVAGGSWKQYPNLSFFIESISTASLLSGRGNNPVSGFAQVKWDQAIQTVISGGQSSSAVLAAAQGAVEAEVRRLGG